MKIQKVKTAMGIRWILLDDNGRPIEYVTRYLKYLEARGCAPGTLRYYAYNLKYFFEYLSTKEYDIDSIQNDDGLSIVDVLVDFILHLEYPELFEKVVDIHGVYPVLEANTINAVMVAVVDFYDYMNISYGYANLATSGDSGFDKDYKTLLSEIVKSKKEVHVKALRKRSPDRGVHYVTRDQMNAMVDVCNYVRDKALITLLFETGMRLSEALGLHISDLKLEDNRIDIVFREDNLNGARVKNFAEGAVFLPPYVSRLLADYIIHEALKYKSDYVFLNLFGPNKGRPMDLEAGKKLFQRISGRCGFYVHAHMLRHGFATERIEDGWSLEEISLYLRHKSLQSTRIYAHFTENAMRERIRPLVKEHEHLPVDLILLK